LESIGSPLRRPSPPEKFPPPLKPYESFPIHLLRPPFFSGRAPHGPPAATQQSRRARPSRSRVFPHDNPPSMSAPPLLKAPAAAAASLVAAAAAHRATAAAAAPSGASRVPPRRLRCSASGAAAVEVRAPMDWATRSLEEMQRAEDFDSFCLMGLSPLDGRYERFTRDLKPFFSEFGLIRYRVIVEVKWLLKLSQIPEINEVPPFSKEAQLFLDAIIQDFSVADAKEVKKIEKTTNHDVKAVEYFLKQKCSSNPEIAKVCQPSV
jgi:adenylosuccinate lyase